MRPGAAEIDPETRLARGRAPEDDGEATELVACDVCGLLQRRPPPLVCPACGAGHG